MDLEGEEICVVTSLMDVAAEEIANIYKSHWAMMNLLN